MMSWLSHAGTENEPPETVLFDYVVTAVGAKPAEAWLSPSKFLTDAIRMPHCTIVNPDFPTVFGGDLTNPIKSVTDAIASGKAAALAIDACFTSGWQDIEPRLNACRFADGPALSMETYLEGRRLTRNRHIVSFSEINTDYFERASRNEPLEADLDLTKPFAETISTLSVSKAKKESSRCFNCGICNDCDNCRVFCPELAVSVDNARERLSESSEALWAFVRKGLRRHPGYGGRGLATPSEEIDDLN